MLATIISIGDELVLGQTVDTNSAWLSQQLLPLGITVAGHITVGDDQNAIVAALQRAQAQADIILVTGGLGPTKDDLTRSALAQLLNVELELHQPSMERIKHFFDRRGRTMTKYNEIQALIPRGCEVIDNNLGTAPGIIARLANASAFFLPGVPNEMTGMFETAVLDRLRRLLSQESVKQVIVCRILRIFGTGESNIAEILGELMARGRNPLVNSTVAQGIISLRILAQASDEPSAANLIEPVEQEIRRRLGNLIFGADDDSLASVVGGLLREQRATLAVAESCTGGLLAKELTDIPGSSDYFSAGWITYCNDAKTSFLNVDSYLIRQHGAVSAPVARQMAQNACSLAQTDYALALTGIAGPTGGTQEKPLGLVYIALADKTDVQVTRNIFPGNRPGIRRRAAYTALNLLRLKIQKT